MVAKKKAGGLVADVVKILGTLDGVDEITESGPQGYKGRNKVILPEECGEQGLAIAVCDVDRGKRIVRVRAKDPAATLRLLDNRLRQSRIMVV